MAEKKGKLLSDAPSDGAIMDRTFHHAQVGYWQSYHVKEAPGAAEENKKRKSQRTIDRWAASF